jgi:cytochrome o ubiquinol oxidase operon protein cyoD
MLDTREEAERGTHTLYGFGYLFSILMTVVAYLIVTKHVMAGLPELFTLVGLGVAQVIIQLFCFFHLGGESKPRWNLIVFLFMLLILSVVVIGSLWIMHNLDYRMMPMQDRGFG